MQLYLIKMGQVKEIKMVSSKIRHNRACNFMRNYIKNAKNIIMKILVL